MKLLDFGLAQLLGSDRLDRCGTPAYMAPEQARGQVVDARADVFAFGVLMYEATSKACCGVSCWARSIGMSE